MTILSDAFGTVLEVTITHLDRYAPYIAMSPPHQLISALAPFEVA